VANVLRDRDRPHHGRPAWISMLEENTCRSARLA